MLQIARVIPETLALSLQIARSATAITATSEEIGLPGKLKSIAEQIVKLRGIRGALVVAYDEEESPLTCGSWGLDLQGTDPDSQLEILVQMRRAIPLGKLKPSWFAIDRSFFKISDEREILALPVQSNAIVWGLVVVLGDDEEPWASRALAALIEAGEILAVAIQNAVRIEAWSRIERLQDLAREEFERGDRNLVGLVRRLSNLYEADVVTLLLEDQNELRLAASTDARLGSEGPVIYRRGEGLTGYVFETKKALRVKSTGDAEEVRRITGLERKGAVHPEHDRQGLFAGQFLAVPLRYGNRVVGVLRMSRRGSITRFTLNDEKSLQFFADLLAIELARSWDLLLLRSVLESTSEAITVSKREPDGRGGTWPKVIMANPGTERLLGRSRGDIIGRDARELYAPGAYESIRRGLVAAFRESTEYGPVETNIQQADGSVRPVEISFRILANRMAAPPTIFAIGLARDISEREQTEALRHQFVNLSEAMGIVYFRTDQEGRTLESTPNESIITGYPSVELVGQPRQRLYDDLREQARLLEELYKREDGQLVGQVVKLRRKDGSLLPVEVDLRILRDSKGHGVGVEGFYRDVSKRIQLQDFLNIDTGRVLADEELVGRLRQHAEFHLDYTISLGHQLQTPLSSLVENLRNFEHGLTRPNFFSERLPYIIGQAVVCTRLVRNLSYMDKILRDEPFHSEKVSLAKLAIETKLDFKHLLEERGLKLALDDISIDRNIQIQGNREMLRQVFVNLVDNAIKYSSSKTTIVIRAQQWPKGAILEVSNKGLPIPEEVCEKIFERGFRTERAQSLIPHGTGLGLWLVRKILKAHGATIGCHAVTEQGQTRNVFRITFPHSMLKPRRPA